MVSHVTCVECQTRVQVREVLRGRARHAGDDRCVCERCLKAHAVTTPRASLMPTSSDPPARSVTRPSRELVIVYFSLPAVGILTGLAAAGLVGELVYLLACGLASVVFWNQRRKVGAVLICVAVARLALTHVLLRDFAAVSTVCTLLTLISGCLFLLGSKRAGREIQELG